MDELKAMQYLTLCIALVVLSNVSIVKGDVKISEESKIRIKRNSLVKSDYGELNTKSTYIKIYLQT